MASSSLFRLTTPHEGVLLVEMNRPPMNVIHRPFWLELHKVFQDAHRDGDVRVVVLASALPRLFTAGLDLNEASILQGDSSFDPARKALALREHIIEMQSAISSIEKCFKPVIAAVHGVCYGLAVDILAATDVRYAKASSSRFSIKEVDVGLAADIGTLARLPKIASNQSAIRELAFTTAEFGAEQAREIGMVSRVVQGGREEVVAAALETAKIIAGKSPIAVLGTKHLLLHAQDHSVQENLEYTAIWNQAMLQSTDTKECVKGVLTKRVPKFKALPKL